MGSRLARFTSLVCTCLVFGAALRSIGVGAQAPTVAAGQAPAAGGSQASGRGRGAPQGGAPIAFDDHTGFRSIFDGKTLTGWDGDPTFWRAENGAIVGESTPEKVIAQNTFLIYRGGEPADFELKIEFRINSANSGVQYRSVQLPEGGAESIGKWVLKGYQADIDFANQYTGMLYEERGRAFLALRGSLSYIGPNQPAARGRQQGAATAPAASPAAAVPASVRGPIGQLEAGDALKGYIRVNDWNQLHIVARGNVLIHVLNGHVTAVFVDDDEVGRSLKGLMGLQIHMGPPMKVEFRNIFLKTL
jgi:hypothetical protein